MSAYRLDGSFLAIEHASRALMLHHLRRHGLLDHRRPGDLPPAPRCRLRRNTAPPGRITSIVEYAAAFYGFALVTPFAVRCRRQLTVCRSSANTAHAARVIRSTAVRPAGAGRRQVGRAAADRPLGQRKLDATLVRDGGQCSTELVEQPSAMSAQAFSNAHCVMISSGFISISSSFISCAPLSLANGCARAPPR